MSGPVRNFEPHAGHRIDLEQLVALRHHADAVQAFARRPSTGDLAGARLTRLRGRGVDFAEVRVYQPGDDVRSIDWRVTARTCRPHTKVFREERERPALLFLDQSAATYFGSRRRLKSVAIAELGALLTWAIIANGDRVGALIYACDGNPHLYRPARARRTVMRILAELSRANRALPAEDNMLTFAAALRELHRIRRPGQQVFILSDFSGLDAAGERELREISRNTELVLISVADPLDAELPPPDLYPVRHGSERRNIDAADQRLRASFARRFADRQARLGRLAHECRAARLDLGTPDNPIERIRARIQGVRT